MNAIVQSDRTSLIATMAAARGMDAEQFAKTVRATVMPAQHTNEQFAALMLVASRYDLDPILKEIYAFPAKGGGIIPIVSIDGWVNLINSHPQANGFEFEFAHTDDGKLFSCTCRMFRKDRDNPVTVTEYLSECLRSTDPWKMQHRMLRHKTLIQTARYAFGFAGIYDEDEGQRIVEMKDVTPLKQPPAPPQIKTGAQTTTEIVDAAPEIITEDGEIVDANEFDAAEYFERLEGLLAAELTVDGIEQVWSDMDAMSIFDGDDTNIDIAQKIKARRLKQIEVR